MPHHINTTPFITFCTMPFIMQQHRILQQHSIQHYLAIVIPYRTTPPHTKTQHHTKLQQHKHPFSSTPHLPPTIKHTPCDPWRTGSGTGTLQSPPVPILIALLTRTTTWTTTASTSAESAGDTVGPAGVAGASAAGHAAGHAARSTARSSTVSPPATTGVVASSSTAGVGAAMVCVVVPTQLPFQ